MMRIMPPECRSNAPPSTLLRWCKFNFVGGIGIGVQFGALFLLKDVLHFNYLAATAIAVEAAVVHNFVWHEQFVWVDRTTPDRTTLERRTLDRSKPAGRKPGGTEPGGMESNRLPSARRRSLHRLRRFHLGNGLVSLLGNLALMRVMVGQLQMNYLFSNALAITLCSLANFLISDSWVFQQE
jgi:putative flippase GtrA